MSVPAAEPDPKQTSAPSSSDLEVVADRSSSGSELRHRILIAEDDLIFANPLEQLIGDEVQVHTVHDGKAVLQAIADIQPAMVLLDDGLPNVSGLDLVEALHASGLTRDIGVVMLTGNGATASMLRAIRDGAINHMVKPVIPKRLIQ